jgi:hypothetical protein
MPERRVEALPPVVTQANCAPALLDRVRRFQDFGARIKAFGVLLATLVAVDLAGYNNVAKSNILHTARDADKEGDLWMEMLNGSLSHSGGRRIPGADLGDGNIPAPQSGHGGRPCLRRLLQTSHPGGAGRRASRPVGR